MSNSGDISFDEDALIRLRDAEQSPLDVPEITIDNDNALWTIFMRYGAYIAVPNAGAHYETCKRITSMSRVDQRFQLFLSRGRHRLQWYDTVFEVEVTSTETRETATIKLDGRAACEALRHFLRHAREHASKKSSTESDMVVAKTFHGSSWHVVSSYPKRTPESLIFKDDSTISGLLTDIQTFIDSESDYKRFGFPFKRNYLIVGPPGSGKSSLIAVAASNFNLDVCFMSLRAGMAEKDLCKAVSTLGDDSMLVIEDVDVICASAAQGNHGATTVLAILTNILDGTLHKPKLITVLTSANPEALESVLVRHGRIDHTSRLEPISEGQVERMVDHAFGVRDRKLTARLWACIDRLGSITSSVLAHFLFRHRKLSPDQITDELCKQLSEGTSTAHIGDATKYNPGAFYM